MKKQNAKAKSSLKQKLVSKKYIPSSITMRRSFIISILLHALALAGAWSYHKGGTQQSGHGGAGQKQNQTNNKDSQRSNAVNVEIIPKKAPAPSSQISTPKHKKEGYWGIGVHIDTRRLDNGDYAEQLTAVVEGYPADEAGLVPGDIIVAVDGKSDGPSFDSIRGDGPRTLKLTIYRRDKGFFTITIERAFVETNRVP